MKSVGNTNLILNKPIFKISVFFQTPSSVTSKSTTTTKKLKIF